MTAAVSTSFRRIVPSRAAVSLEIKGQEPPRCRAFTLGFIGVCCMILLGGTGNAYVAGLALFLPGLALMVRPPSSRPGGVTELALLGFVAVLAFAFIPPFYWPEPDWRRTAETLHRMDLGWALTIQPRLSLEALLLCIGGVAWFYVAGSWFINHAGRKRIYLWLSGALGVFSALIIWADLVGWRYPSAPDSSVFSFFPDPAMTGNFIGIGAALSFAFGVEGMKGQRLVALIGLAAAALGCAAMFLQGSGTGLALFLVGVLLYFAMRNRRAKHSLKKRIVGLLVLVLLVVAATNSAFMREQTADILAESKQWLSDSRIPLYRDALTMFGHAPLTGVGAGNFSAIFSQYREHSRSSLSFEHAGSDWFMMATQLGFAGVLAAALFLYGYTKRLKGSKRGQFDVYRRMALIGVILFLLHGLFDVPGHRVGTAFFVILLAGVALPRHRVELVGFNSKVLRSVGGVLALMGLVWFFGALFSWPVHSDTMDQLAQDRLERAIAAENLEAAENLLLKSTARRPFDWESHSRLARVLLEGRRELALAEESFGRAAFVEPILGVVRFEEGLAWAPFNRQQTFAAWENALLREMADKEVIFARMLREAEGNRGLMESLGLLSRMAPEYRLRYLLTLGRDRFMETLEWDLESDPNLGQFSEDGRRRLLAHWIRFGDTAQAERFLEANKEEFRERWWLWSLLRMNQARFNEALEFVREGLEAPAAPVAPEEVLKIEERELARLKRTFELISPDVNIGLTLLSYYLAERDYPSALAVVNQVIELPNPPLSVYYWQAEILFQLNNAIESWYAFEFYLQKAAIVDTPLSR